MLIGVYELDVFGEARKSSEGFLVVDFLCGTISGATPSPELAKAVSLSKDALADLCNRQGASVSLFRVLKARYSSDSLGHRVVIEIEDNEGRHSTDEYVGMPLSRIKKRDSLGRVRTER